MIVDDDNAIRVSLTMLLRHSGHEVKAVASPSEAIDVVRAVKPQLVLLDMNFTHSTSGNEGLTLLKQIKVFQPETPVILMTAWGSIPLAVEGVKSGAVDFITKPWDNRILLERIKAVLALSDVQEKTSPSSFDRSRIIGDSQALRQVLDTVERIAATNAPVLIMGENGTGKELVAETLHINSQRRKAPFVKVNLGGISRSLFESEMFGHRKGAFTGAIADREGRFSVADKGTIFLDEIGELDLNSQVKLLRVLQEHTFEVLGESRPRKVDIRVVCATNADLPAMVADHRFREDLLYRINLITLHLPPLRERRDDIPALVRHFAAQSGRRGAEFSAEAMALLTRLPFYGNIRELKNTVERAILISPSDIIGPESIEHNLSPAPRNEQRSGDTLAGMTLEDMERHAILKALEETSGNLSKVATRLGITRQSLYRRMEKYGINQ